MGISRTYWDNNPEDRRYVLDFWSWLRAQPQQAWLSYALSANWDQADKIFLEMVQDPRCDRALASLLFWRSEPSYYVRQGTAPHPNTLIAAILDRVNNGGFTANNLRYDRLDVLAWAQEYVAALRAGNGPPPFSLPRELCANFAGTNPPLPSYDAETEADLAELFNMVDGRLWRSDEEYRAANRAGGSWRVAQYFRLPRKVAALDGLSDIEAVEAVFGRNAAFQKALKRMRRADRPAGPWGMNPDLRQRALGLGLLIFAALGLVLVLWGWVAS